MTEAFVDTLKRDCVRVNPTSDARTVIEQLTTWLVHFTDGHPHGALRYGLPREFVA